MQTDREDIELDQICGRCGGDVMISTHEGWKVMVQHVDSLREASHRVWMLEDNDEERQTYLAAQFERISNLGL